MAKALHVLEPESGTWIPHQKILLMCHGLNLSRDDGDTDRDFACLLMGQFLADFPQIKEIEYAFNRRVTPESASMGMIKLAKQRRFDAFIIPEAQTLLFKIAIGVAFPNVKERPSRVVVVSSDTVADFKRLLRVKESSDDLPNDHSDAIRRAWLQPTRKWWRFWT
jgi:hypothetical protein